MSNQNQPTAPIEGHAPAPFASMRDRIAAAAITVPKPFPIASLGGMEILLRKLPAKFVDDRQASIMGSNGRLNPEAMADFRVTMVATAICDESGKAIFSKEEVGQWDNAIVYEIMDIVQRENKIDNASKDEVGKG